MGFGVISSCVLSLCNQQVSLCGFWCDQQLSVCYACVISRCHSGICMLSKRNQQVSLLSFFFYKQACV